MNATIAQIRQRIKDGDYATANRLAIALNRALDDALGIESQCLDDPGEYCRKVNRLRFVPGVDPPVCKFGPGGDYDQDWPEKEELSRCGPIGR